MFLPVLEAVSRSTHQLCDSILLLLVAFVALAFEYFEQLVNLEINGAATEILSSIGDSVACVL